jgi:hypothetical protein
MTPTAVLVSMDLSLCVVPDTTEALGNSFTAVNCSMSNIPAGPRNLSVSVDPANNRGAALFPDSLYQVSPVDGTPRMFVVHGSIESLSTKVAGLRGGASLVITGTGFDPMAANNVVTVAGVPCTVTDATGSSLTCTLGAASGATAPPTALPSQGGGRGLLVQFHDFNNNDFGKVATGLVGYVTAPGFPEKSWVTTAGAVGAGGLMSQWGTCGVVWCVCRLCVCFCRLCVACVSPVSVSVCVTT